MQLIFIQFVIRNLRFEKKLSYMCSTTQKSSIIPYLYVLCRRARGIGMRNTGKQYSTIRGIPTKPPPLWNVISLRTPAYAHTPSSFQAYTATPNISNITFWGLPRVSRFPFALTRLSRHNDDASRTKVFSLYSAARLTVHVGSSIMSLVQERLVGVRFISNTFALKYTTYL